MKRLIDDLCHRAKLITPRAASKQSWIAQDNFIGRRVTELTTALSSLITSSIKQRRRLSASFSTELQSFVVWSPRSEPPWRQLEGRHLRITRHAVAHVPDAEHVAPLTRAEAPWLRKTAIGASTRPQRPHPTWLIFICCWSAFPREREREIQTAPVKLRVLLCSMYTAVMKARATSEGEKKVPVLWDAALLGKEKKKAVLAVDVAIFALYQKSKKTKKNSFRISRSGSLPCHGSSEYSQEMQRNNFQLLPIDSKLLCDNTALFSLRGIPGSCTEISERARASVFDDWRPTEFFVLQKASVKLRQLSSLIQWAYC